PLHPLDLHSFPTRRSSDLLGLTSQVCRPSSLQADLAYHKWYTACERTDTILADRVLRTRRGRMPGPGFSECARQASSGQGAGAGDRKSTRLNSSHRTISYA